MPCHSIYDFVLLITTSNVEWRDKNVKTTFQEGLLVFQRRFHPPARIIACTKVWRLLSAKE